VVLEAGEVVIDKVSGIVAVILGGRASSWSSFLTQTLFVPSINSLRGSERKTERFRESIPRYVCDMPLG